MPAGIEPRGYGRVRVACVEVNGGVLQIPASSSGAANISMPDDRGLVGHQYVASGSAAAARRKARRSHRNKGYIATAGQNYGDSALNCFRVLV